MSQMNINEYNIVLARAESERDRQSSASTQARDLMEQFGPEKMLEKLLQIFGVLGSALKG